MNCYNLYYKDSLRGLFFPQYQLIWIKEREGSERSLEHEFFHSYTNFLYPAHLFHFYNCLCDLAKQPPAQVGIENFRDIVEASVLVWQKVTGRISNFEETRAEPEHIYLAEEIAVLKDRLIPSGHKEVNLELEVFHGLLMFLLHVIPQSANYGKKIVNIFKDNLPDIKWHNRYELFFQLYFSYNKLLKDNPCLTHLFKLDYHLDYHRVIGDIFIFVRAALWILLSKYRDDLLPFIVSLTSLFSLGSLTVLPIIYTDEEKRRMRIEVVHSTRRSINVTEKAISVAEMKLKIQMDGKHTCFATQLFKQILEETKFFVISKDKKRIVSFIKHFLNLIEDKFHSINIENCDCIACKSTYNSAILPYKNIFKTGFKKTKNLFVELSQQYEPWFFGTKGIEWTGRLIKIPLADYDINLQYDYL